VDQESVQKEHSPIFNEEETKNLVDFFTFLIKLDQKHRENNSE
jgi:hypothetical protein